MKFPNRLVKGRLLKRYKRFLADVVLEIDGQERTVVAHCANPGSMMGLAEPGATVWLLPNSNPKAKLDWRWELTDCGSSLVCVNTARANQVVAEALADGAIPDLSDHDAVRPEVPYGEGSRVDFLLTSQGRPDTYVEVKSVTLSRGPGDGGGVSDGQRTAEFPDARTARGTKHLHDLGKVRADGNRAVMLFLVQRTDCSHFRPAEDIDPLYAETLRQAHAGGVEMLCYTASITTDAITMDAAIPVYLD